MMTGKAEGALALHNTLTGRKEPFKPIKEGHVSMYVCGITPYDETHLGHARCYVVFDVLKRVLKAAGYKTFHVQNYTDVDDKIIERANKAHVDFQAFIRPFIEGFERTMEALQVLPADVYPRVSDHMREIIGLIEQLLSRGLAYQVGGNVFYSVRKFQPYGQLSKRNLDSLAAGARIAIDEEKRDPLDFALWKAAKPGEPSWDSPWGKGRPGWHIECSAMSMKYLGQDFDIHGGGLDLIFPHHENEIAQSVGATGGLFSRYWIHNGFVTINQEKMSKSLGNFFTLKDVLAQFDPMVVRYFLLTQHYRSPLNYSDQELKACETAWLNRVAGAYRITTEHQGQSSPASANGGLDATSAALRANFYDALFDDLNTAAALAALNQVCTQVYKAQADAPVQKDQTKWHGYQKLIDEMCVVLGLKLPVEQDWSEEIRRLVNRREEARRAKDWALSDQLRAELQKKGALVEDTPGGPRLKKI